MKNKIKGSGVNHYLFKQLARCHHLLKKVGRGRLVGTIFVPKINSLATPSHVYHINAQTDATGIEPGLYKCDTNVLLQSTLEP